MNGKCLALGLMLSVAGCGTSQNTNEVSPPEVVLPPLVPPPVENEPPMAIAGSDVDVDLTSVVEFTLDAGGSYDNDGEIIVYRWETEGGEVFFGQTLSITQLPMGSSTLTLEVTDDGGAQSTDSIDVTLRGPQDGLWSRSLYGNSYSFYVRRGLYGMYVDYFYYDLSGQCNVPNGTAGFHLYGSPCTAGITNHNMVCGDASSDPGVNINFNPDNVNPIATSATATLTFDGCPNAVTILLWPQ